MREEFVADSGASTTCATATLPAARSAGPAFDEPRDAGLGVESVLLYASAVDHVNDAVDGDRRLGNVGSHDNLALAGRRRAEDARLLLRRQVCVQRQNEQGGECVRRDCCANRFDGLLDLEDTGRENQNVATGVCRSLQAVGDLLQNRVSALRIGERTVEETSPSRRRDQSRSSRPARRPRALAEPARPTRTHRAR